MKVEQILEVKPNDFKDLTRTTFLSGGKQIYILTKPQNAPSVGTVLPAGNVAVDGRGHLKFTKTPQDYNAPQPQKQGERQFKADPESRASIEKQKALAEAVNFVNGVNMSIEEAKRLAYVLDVAKAFLDFLKDPEAQPTLDLPPIDNYDEIAKEINDEPF